MRLNRFVCRYHGSTGKRCVAQDEFLEHGNRFYSAFPIPKTLQSFVNQSQYVGLGLMCKRYTDIWYNNLIDNAEEKVYTKSVAPPMTQERQLLYKVFLLLKTHVASAVRIAFPMNYIGGR